MNIINITLILFSSILFSNECNANDDKLSMGISAIINQVIAVDGEIEIKVNGNYDYIDIFADNKLIIRKFKLDKFNENLIYINKKSYGFNTSELVEFRIMAYYGLDSFGKSIILKK